MESEKLAIAVDGGDGAMRARRVGRMGCKYLSQTPRRNSYCGWPGKQGARASPIEAFVRSSIIRCIAFAFVQISGAYR